MRLSKVAAGAILFFTALGASASAEQVRLVRTSQTWGTEVREGKIQAHIGIAAECLQNADNGLTVSSFQSAGATGAHVTWSHGRSALNWSGEHRTW